MIRQPYVTYILTGRKKWELRGTATHVRGRIGLIASGSGTILGECIVEDCIGPLEFSQLFASPFLSTEERLELKADHQVPYLQKDGIRSKTYAWVVTEPRLYRIPIPYRHPSGAITFVDLTKPGVVECSEASPSRTIRQLQLF
ncbi:ASCH domain-containing protein [Asticcacaulis currens]|uniref:ASCH domain-containing protein n=1 Tax=Asticcacaulis currens TaxID=2984210 RepID=UPI0034A3794A